MAVEKWHHPQKDLFLISLTFTVLICLPPGSIFPRMTKVDGTKESVSVFVQSKQEEALFSPVPIPK